jgi:hypothetical protein
MTTLNPPAMAVRKAEPLQLPFLRRIRKLWSRIAPVAASEPAVTREAMGMDFAEPLELSFPARVRKFLWLSNGLFGAASFAMPALGILALGSVQTRGLGANFLAGIVSACLFGLASLLRFGPEEV